MAYGNVGRLPLPTYMTMQGTTATLTLTLFNGCTIAYTDEGSGPDTIFFIHGLGTYSGTWQKNIASLKSTHRCIAIDLPGNGHSGTGNYPYTMDFFAHCVIDAIGRLGLKHVTLAGHSMGGQIALTAALLAPQCCERLLLFAPAGFETFTAHEQMMYKASISYASWLTTNEGAIRHLVQAGFRNMPKDANKLSDTLTKLMHRQPARHYKMMTDKCIHAMLDEPVYDRLKKIEQPVLAIFGEDDALIPNTLLHPSTTKQVGAAGIKQLKHGVLKMVPRCGHFVQWECAAEVNKLVTDWLGVKAV
jgi:pimeloyl-ACP methyl ester carboxylesterase